MTKKKKHRVRNTLLNLAIIACLAVIAVCGYKIGSFFWDIHKSKSVNEELIKSVPQPSSAPSASTDARWVPTQQTYDALHAENSDYVGWILWDSDLISEPIVQGKTNNSYLRTDFKGNYSVWGTVFVDADETLPATNTMIYGHSYGGVKTDHTKFSQLQNMTDQTFCDQNATFKIYWDGRIDSYKVFAVSVVDSSTDDWIYSKGEFTDGSDEQQWIDDAVNRSQISSDIVPSVTDKFVTLQTCADQTSALRYIVSAVQTDEQPYKQ